MYCSTLERGYSPSEARELRAIASFHHPTGYAYGYIKMTQLIHNDGSQSETVIEVKLRHPGKNDRNSTRNHNWQIFVNPVGVDAAVKPTITRCVAGGYVWNPYYTQLADPLNVCSQVIFKEHSKIRRIYLFSWISMNRSAVRIILCAATLAMWAPVWEQ